jgi:hypothetical protein
METTILEDRLNHLLAALASEARSGLNLSASSKGSERELLVTGLMQRVFPPHCRFGSGDIIDTYGNQSGQVDVVLESNLSLSFPTSAGVSRIYLAEGVAAAIEVKSDIRSQWSQIVPKAEAIKRLRRRTPGFAASTSAEFFERLATHPAIGDQMADAARILRRHAANEPVRQRDLPVYVIGFGGWTDPDTLRAKALEIGVDALVVLGAEPRAAIRDYGRDLDGARGGSVMRTCTGPDVLLYLLQQLSEDWRLDVGSLAQQLLPYSRHNDGDLVTLEEHIADPSGADGDSPRVPSVDQ